MDWQLLGLSFIAVFLSELGDKSQLAAIALGGGSKHPRAVFLGTAAALLLTSLLGALLGEGTAQLLPTRLVKAIAAIGFAVMAVRLLWPEPTLNGFGDEASNLAGSPQASQDSAAQ
ncbi:MAG: TMEM165/GDT1 family protein [Leptolyngbyaceae cyanobacterium T60_A2020_046]|nr:TMEM165/GDT1 family protein [Leptolyngbyaceae cyanobacterium T60_A2020_046]